MKCAHDRPTNRPLYTFDTTVFAIKDHLKSTIIHRPAEFRMVNSLPYIHIARMHIATCRKLRDREHRVKFGSVKTMRNTSLVVQAIRVASV